MDFSQALTYPFNDPDGIKKLLIAVAITLGMFIIPVIGWIGGGLLFMGWSYEITRRVRGGDPTPLPAWDDFGGLISRGLQLAIALLVYQLPTVIFFCVAFGALGLPFLGLGDEDLIGVLGTAGLGIFSCCLCIVMLYSLAASLFYWGGYMRYLDNEQLGTFFQFGENLALIQSNVGDFGMALLFVIVGNLIGGIISGTGIGVLFAPAFQTYFQAHILGQLARKLRGEGAAAVPQV